MTGPPGPAAGPGAGELRLRRPTLADESACRAAHAELAADGFDFLFSPELPWPAQLAELAREAAGTDLPRGRVPADYLLADVSGEVVGRVSVRHALTPALLELGGHVGYAVRPAWRRRGYGRAILALALRRCAALGLAEVLVTCDEDNLASARVIEACGGVLEDVRPQPGGAPGKRRYWVSS
ncbi:GNAT family N-acetyltransferase [Ornithinicoccus halotolerans]|uniref:GNAT family N-acetyltransferase n=1 Tax=Ornithinicoccus halotolerans TaxID=1748220 RepID=UPI001E58A0BD|nr:GNAT family N-acetyltransferase [Ornithinicoccus halotolerans]